MDWKNSEDAVAPFGWTAKGFAGHVGDMRKCAGGWNAYAPGQSQGQLYTRLKGFGRATVKYRDCWSQGFIGVYLNGKQIDESSTNSGEQRTFRLGIGMREP